MILCKWASRFFYLEGIIPYSCAFSRLTGYASEIL